MSYILFNVVISRLLNSLPIEAKRLMSVDTIFIFPANFCLFVVLEWVISLFPPLFCPPILF